jgi:hypothetical protein
MSTPTAAFSDGCWVLISMTAMFVWGMAAYKSFTLWNNVKKRAIVLFAIFCGFGSSFSFLFIPLFRFQNGTAAGGPVQRDWTGIYAVFLIGHELSMLYIALMRLSLTRRVGNERVTNVLTVLVVISSLLLLAWYIGFTMIPWSPEYGSFNGPVPNFQTNLIRTLATISVVSKLFGACVEVYVISYFRSVLFKGFAKVKISALGPIEYCAILSSAWTVAVTILGSLGFSQYSLFFTNMKPISLTLTLSLRCLSIVNSVEQVKDNYATAKGSTAASAQSNSMSKV